MKNKIVFLLLLVLSITSNMWSQVGIGTSSPNSNAVLELSSTTQGMKFPKMTTTERNAIASPAKGLTVFDTDLNCLMVNFGTTSSANWKCIGGVSTNHPSTNGTGIVSAYTCDTASAGTMTQGTATGSGVTQTITATVTAVGTYNISTTINGITFSGSGYFVATGDRAVLLTAAGTPSLGGFHTFTLNTTPNCSFTRSTGTIPGVISLATVSNTYIASVYDVDYLPYSSPTTTATTATAPTATPIITMPAVPSSRRSPSSAMSLRLKPPNRWPSTPPATAGRRAGPGSDPVCAGVSQRPDALSLGRDAGAVHRARRLDQDPWSVDAARLTPSCVFSTTRDVEISEAGQILLVTMSISCR